MEVLKHKGNWWVVKVPDPQCVTMGPYNTKADAEDCMRRTAKFFAAEEAGRLEKFINGEAKR
jgi:hypothetical protein